MELKLTGPAFNHGSQTPSRYTCDGENMNPHPVIQGVLPQAKSLVLVVEDPDAPMAERLGTCSRTSEVPL